MAESGWTCLELRQRDPRVECPAFLAFVRRRPCCACGAPAPSQAAHVRMGEPRLGKRNAGIGEKPSDRWAVPLCAPCHLDSPNAQHRVGEHRFWIGVGLNPFKVAMDLYAQFERGRTPEQKERRARRNSSGFPKTSSQLKRSAKIPRGANPWPAKGTRKFSRRTQ